MPGKLGDLKSKIWNLSLEALGICSENVYIYDENIGYYKFYINFEDPYF